MLASDFHYELPDESIAQSAIEPRDASRLLVTSTETDHTFRDLPSLLDPGDLLVVNRTRVRAARIRGVKETGGSIEVLLLRRLDTERWEAMVRPARRVRPGTTIAFDGAMGEVLTDPQRGVATLAITGWSSPLKMWTSACCDFHRRFQDRVPIPMTTSPVTSWRIHRPTGARGVRARK